MQPVCIVMACRSKTKQIGAPATVHFRRLPTGRRETKFEALSELRLESAAWTNAPSEWRAPFLPASTGAWATYPGLDRLFKYNGSGVMPGRTWIIAPDVTSLKRRWKALIGASPEAKDPLLQPHLNRGKLGDRHAAKVLDDALPGFPIKKKSLADEVSDETDAIPYAFRSFDRQWIIPDKRLINRPNPELWRSRSVHQIYLTAPSDRSPSDGPALTFTELIPDLHHYAGRGGRVIPLWADEDGMAPNTPNQLLPTLSARLGTTIGPEHFMAYIAAVAANPAYTERFQKNLSTPGLRIPITANESLFRQAVEIGRRVLWLHTFGERMCDAEHGRPEGPPRLPAGRAPAVPKQGAIPATPDEMPDTLDYDVGKHRLLVGSGYVDNVLPPVWKYEVSGKQVLTQWFSYRKKNRERPLMGDRRQPSALGDIQSDQWLPEYTSELLNVLNVLTLLVELEPQQAALLDRICAGPLISESELQEAGAFAQPAAKPKKRRPPKSAALFDESS